MEEIFSIFDSNIMTYTRGNDIFYNAMDTAFALGFGNPERAVEEHVQSEDKVRINGMAYITEPAVYELAFESDSEVAKRFQSEVIRMLLGR